MVSSGPLLWTPLLVRSTTPHSHWQRAALRHSERRHRRHHGQFVSLDRRCYSVVFRDVDDPLALRVVQATHILRVSSDGFAVPGDRGAGSSKSEERRQNDTADYKYAASDVATLYGANVDPLAVLVLFVRVRWAILHFA